MYPKVYNDSTVVITNTQLKHANIKIRMVESLTLINKELEKEVLNYKKLNNNFVKIDSLNQIKIDYLNNTISDNNNKIKKLKKEKSTYKKASILTGLLAAVLIFI